MKPKHFYIQLEDVRKALLATHKALLIFEKRQYEAVYGRIVNTHEYLSAVDQHPSFQWLKSLSALITTIDEFTEEKETPGATLEGIMMYIDLLFTPSENQKPFTEKYFFAIQKDPDVLIAHTKLKSAISELKK